MPRARSGLHVGRQLDRQAVGRAPQARRVLGQLRHVPAARPQGLEDAVAQLEAAVEDRQVRPLGRPHRCRRPTRTGAPRRSPLHLRRADRRQRPARLATVSSHSSCGSLRQVMPPPTWSVRRSPSATNVRMRIDEPRRPSGPSHAIAPQYGPRRTGSRPSMISIARILGAPVIEPPGNEAARRSKASASGRELPGHRGDEVLDCRGPLEAQESRHAHGSGLADPPEVVAQDVHDHHVLGLVLAAGEELARPAPGPRPGVRPRGRVPLIGSVLTPPVAVHGEERLGRGREEGARRAGGGRGAQVQVPGEQRRVAGPQPAEERPRVAVEGGLQAPGEVGLVDLAPADGRPDRLHAGDPGRRGRSATRTRSARTALELGSVGRRIADRQLRPRQRVQAAKHLARPGDRARPSSPSTARTPSQAVPCAGPTRSPSRGARGAAPAGAGPRARSRAGARAAGRGRSPGSPRARRRTAGSRPVPGTPGPPGTPRPCAPAAPAPRRTGPAPPPGRR